MFTYLLYAYQITHPRHLLVENFRNEGTNKAIINAIIPKNLKKYNNKHL